MEKPPVNPKPNMRYPGQPKMTGYPLILHPGNNVAGTRLVSFDRRTNYFVQADGSIKREGKK